MQTLDMLGKPCPIPVVQAKKALQQPGATGVAVMVDNWVAVQNLQKMATGLGYTFTYAQDNEKQWTATIMLEGAAPPPRPTQATAPAPAPIQAGTPAPATILITKAQLGAGSEELGNILMKGYIFSLTELDPPPKTLLFLNSGALLTIQGANTVPDLQALAQKGTAIYTCGTCLNYYGATEKLAVGEITDMMGISSRLAAAGHLITL